jgi:sec-independent protein translocase protein TatC
VNVPPDHDEIDKTKAPLIEHLAELRTRLIRSLWAVVAAFVVSFYFAERIYLILVQPYADAVKDRPDHDLIFTALYEPFVTYIWVAIFSALCVSFPIIAIQVWKFVAPGLYRNEQRAFLPYLVATPVLFILGGLLVYFLIMPTAINFFLSFEVAPSEGGIGMQAMPKVNEYLDLVMALIFAFGVSFQLPVVLTLLGHVGIVSSQFLQKHRRYAIVIVFAIAAVLTPPDVLSQLMLAIPMLGLYEISVWTVKLIERARARAAMPDPDVATSPPPP